MWKAQEKLPKSASCPRAGKSSIHRTLLWQNWEGDPGVLVLCFHHHPPPPHPWYGTQRGFCPAPSPTGGWALHSPPSLPPGLGCFFPGAVVGPSLCNTGLRVASATGAWGCRLGVDPITGPFWDVCPGTGTYPAKRTVACFAGYVLVPGKRDGNAKSACAVLVHTWHRV